MADGRGRQGGRPPTLPEALLPVIISAMAAVVTPRATVIAAPLLQMVGMGVIMGLGYSHLLWGFADGEKRHRGQFCFGLSTVRAIMKGQGWRSCKPQGAARKLPADWVEQRCVFVAALAYLIPYSPLGDREGAGRERRRDYLALKRPLSAKCPSSTRASLKRLYVQ